MKGTPFTQHENSYTGIYDHFSIVIKFILPSYISLNTIRPEIVETINKKRQKN